MKKVKGIVIPILLVFMALLTMPFSVVYADTISQANIKGANFECIDITPIENSEVNMHSNFYQRAIYTFHFQAVLDQSYYGYVTGRFQGTYQSYDPYTQAGVMTKTADSYNRSFYVCGQTIDYYMQTQGWIEVNQQNSYTITYATQTFTYSGSNVVPFGYQTTLDEISQNIEDMEIEQQNISSYLYDSTNGSIIEQVMTTNQLIQLAGQYFLRMVDLLEYIDSDVDLISKLRQWQVPIYSIPFVYNVMMRTQYDNIMLIQDYNYFQYPLFNIGNLTQISSAYMQPGKEYVLIFGTTGNYGITSVHNAYTLTGYSYGSDNITYKTKVLSNSFINGYAEYRLFKFTINVTSADSVRLNYVGNTQQMFIPIYFGENHGYFDEQFKEMYDLIDTSTNDALDDFTSDFTITSDNVIGIEDTIGNGFTGALQNVPSSFDFLSNFGASFISSAQWVRDQYNNMTVGNPFGSLITFSLILGIGLLLLGRKLL